jgi:hypothetical protein
MTVDKLYIIKFFEHIKDADDDTKNYFAELLGHTVRRAKNRNELAALYYQRKKARLQKEKEEAAAKAAAEQEAALKAAALAAAEAAAALAAVPEPKKDRRLSNYSVGSATREPLPPISEYPPVIANTKARKN